MDFVTGLSVLTNWKGKNYNFILVIINRLIKMVYYKPKKVTIDALGLAKVIFNEIVWHYGLLNLIVSDRSLLLIFKFWLLLCYFFSIKRRLSTTFHPQTDSQTEWQNNIIEVYFWFFINFKQNNWAKLLSMAEFAYNNAKNASSGYTFFELNSGYHSWMLYKDDVNPCSKSKSTDKLSTELKKLIIVCGKNLYHA